MPVARKRTPSCFTLSKEATETLAALADDRGENKSQMVERLIMEAAQRRGHSGRFEDNKLGRLFVARCDAT